MPFIHAWNKQDAFHQIHALVRGAHGGASRTDVAPVDVSAALDTTGGRDALGAGLDETISMSLNTSRVASARRSL